MKSRTDKDIIVVACVSRAFCLLIAFLSHLGLRLDDQRNSILLGSGSWCESIDPLVQWDGIHFLNIALRGYDSVLSHAFFPGLPLMMRILRSVVGDVCGDPARDLALFGLVFVQASSVVAAVGLYRLSCGVLGNEQAAYRSTLFYIFSSSNIFMSALYTESPFSMLTFWGLYWLYVRGSFIWSAVLFACGCLFRSNGVLAIFYIGAVAVKRRQLYEGLVASLFIYLPYLLYSTWSRNVYCEGVSAQEWCAFKSIYGHVQSAFWNVSFLSYWKWGNWPYFLLMAPTLVVALHAPFYWLKDFRLHKNHNTHFSKLVDALPFLLQMGVLTAFTVFIANCQILTRILSSCPLYFWTLHRITQRPSLIGSVLFALHLGYYLAGPLVFSNGLNWT